MKDVDNVTLKQRFIGVGIAQCLALFPGVSFRGNDHGGLIIGFDRLVAGEFSSFSPFDHVGGNRARFAFDSARASLSDIPLFAVGFVTSFSPH